MRINETHPDLATVISKYVHGQGKATCMEGTGDLLSFVWEFATLQDRIGWDNFMMGLISEKLLSIQDLYLCVRGSMGSSGK
jgi:hypothetical protein